MPVYEGIDGVVRKRKEWPIGIDGVVRQQKEHWAGIDGVQRKIFSKEPTVGDLAIGDIVSLNVNGVPTDFIVVNQGLPSALYDSSCDGTWLLMKNIYDNRIWNSSNVNDYGNSAINAYLNSTFLNMLDPEIQIAIKHVKIPYREGSGTSNTVTSGANGLSAKIFLLSATEVSFNVDYMPANEGAELSYFAGCSDEGDDIKRVANYNGSASRWWLRSPYTYSSNYTLVVNTRGGSQSGYSSGTYGSRPCLILPKDFSL